jgi:hypothetical protein
LFEEKGREYLSTLPEDKERMLPPLLEEEKGETVTYFV